MTIDKVERNTWTEFYEIFEISYTSSKVCIEGIAVNMLDSTRKTGHDRCVESLVSEKG
jgi:hypothetical protein